MIVITLRHRSTFEQTFSFPVDRVQIDTDTQELIVPPYGPHHRAIQLSTEDRTITLRSHPDA